MCDNCREWYHKVHVRTYHAQFGKQNPNGYAVCVHHISCLYLIMIVLSLQWYHNNHCLNCSKIANEVLHFNVAQIAYHFYEVLS